MSDPHANSADPQQDPVAPLESAATEPDAPSGSSIPKLDRRKTIIIGLIEIVVLVIIFARVLPQVGSYSDAADAIRGLSALSIAGIVVAVLGYLAWYGLPFVAAAPGLGYWRGQQINQGAFAISNGVPGGGAFGLGVQYAMFASFRYPAPAATSAIAAVGVWSIFVTLGMPILGVLAFLAAGRAQDASLLPAVIGLLVLVGSVIVFALIMRSESAARSLGSLGNRAFQALPTRFTAGRDIDLVETVLAFRTSIVTLVTTRWAHLTVAQFGVSLWQFGILYAALRGIEGWDQGGTAFLVVFGAFAISQIGLMIPITPGGLGTVDAAMVALLTSAGTDPGTATAATLVWRAASFVPQIAIGVIALIAWTRDAAKLAADPSGSASGSPSAS